MGSTGTTDAGRVIDAASFEAVRKVVRARSGIVLSENKQAMVSARLSKRMRALSIETFAGYVAYLENDRNGKELVELLDAISTNVTSFYREGAHFNYLANWLASLVPGRRDPLRIWCAAASTGEEPYTIAMTVREGIGDAPVQARILATDICTRVLALAQAGVYEADRVEPVPRHQRERWFVEQRGPKGRAYAVKPELKGMLRFRRFNLSTFPYPVRPPLDIVFCRNVMIYFDDPLRRRIVGEFFRLLRPGGLLFVGHSECLAGLSKDFQTVAPTIYQKPFDSALTKRVTA